MAEILSSLSPDGTLSVWYVGRLRQLSSTLPKRWVSLSSLGDLDQNLWFNTYGEVATCRAVAVHAKRIYEANLEYPVLLSPEGEVMDGMHRVAKAWLSGMSEILAIQFTEMPPPDEVIPGYDMIRHGIPGQTESSP
jgi:hypothetical protein